MKTLAKILFLITTITTLPSFCAWRISESTDEMTDEPAYYVHTRGSIISMDEYMSYRPDLVLKLSPKGISPAGEMTYKGEIMLQIETDAFTRDACEITTRYNREKATVETWYTSAGRRAAFAPASKEMTSKLMGSTNLTVRYTTTLGYVRTSTFDVSGLSNALNRIRAQYLKTNPPKAEPVAKPAATAKPEPPAEAQNAERKPPKATPRKSYCTKCKNTGTILGWITCPGCGGRFMSGGSRCQVCIRSLHLGKIRSEIPCPKCHPESARPQQSGGFGNR